MCSNGIRRSIFHSVDLGGAGEAHRAHQARHGTTRHADAVPPQLLPDFPGAVDLLVLVIAPLNLDAALIVASCARADRRVGSVRWCRWR